MENPYESPRSTGEPASGDRGARVGKAIGWGILGFVAAGAITGLAVFVVAAMFVDSIQGLVVAFSSPGVVGPLVGISLWAATRRRARPFGRGALVLGVTCFLVVGGCLLTLFGLG